jgi:hypothetical protein
VDGLFQGCRWAAFYLGADAFEVPTTTSLFAFLSPVVFGGSAAAAAADSSSNFPTQLMSTPDSSSISTNTHIKKTSPVSVVALQWVSQITEPRFLIKQEFHSLLCDRV